MSTILKNPFRVLLLAALAGAVASCSKSSYMSSPTGPSESSVVITINGRNGNMSFSPESASVKMGQTVVWRNADSITHAIAQDGGRFSTGAIPGGTTSSPVVVSSTGVLPYHCTIHPSMTGSLTGTSSTPQY